MLRMKMLRFAVTGLILLVALMTSQRSAPAQNPPAPGTAKPARAGIGALGRIEPGNGVVRVAARSLSGQPSIVAKLPVQEGDQVKAGQVLAELDAAVVLQAVRQLAEGKVEMSRKRLRQVEAGAKPADIAAQKAEIARIDVELEDAQRDLRREEDLRKGDSAAQAAVDRARVRVNTLTLLRQQAVDRLTSLSEVREVDVAVVRAELEANLREVARARAEYDASIVRAPISGRIIKIYSWPGEEVGPKGVMEIANTDQMYVLAEVVENDLARVKVGQQARITGSGLPGELSGKVEKVGTKVMENSILQLNPANFSDARVAEVRIRLDDGQRVAHLIHLRVNVVIAP